LDLEFVPGKGPQINNPLATTRDIDLLSTPPAEETMPATLEAIRIVSAELETRGLPLIGFAGAPFTLASYAIEGGGSKNYLKAKSLMYAEPAAWQRLMEKLVTVVGDYLLKQVRAGASALQVFDSWAGAVGELDYARYVQPYNTALFKMLQKAGVPVINFSTGTSAYLPRVAACGGDVISVDWKLPLDVAWEQVGDERAIQGNLDPIALLAPWRELQPRVDDILERVGGRPGHIFNLGHGILPSVSVDTVKRLVDHVHTRSEATR
ncbi:MAG: uroporphyrinogen decarboxylase, partial [Delftia sp.]|nr:uroporphyrinogen decarboxylase [Delftia sp.]